MINLLAQLNAADLLQTDIAPNAAEMVERFSKHSNAKRRGGFGNPLAIRLPLWDPDRFLERTLPIVRYVFSRVAATIWLLTVLSAMVLVGIHWNELSENISDRILAAEGLLLTAMVFPTLKFFHELGHAYSTKVAGGEVHELGVMLLVFAPVPYVDASASVAFRSKWRRALVGMAGMLTELFIAAMAMFAWSLAEPGLFRSLCFQTVLIAGVSTVVFNINPLLRFDGYYILSDLLEMPNLGGSIHALLVTAGGTLPPGRAGQLAPCHGWREILAFDLCATRLCVSRLRPFQHLDLRCLAIFRGGRVDRHLGTGSRAGATSLERPQIRTYQRAPRKAPPESRLNQPCSYRVHPGRPVPRPDAAAYGLQRP